MKRIQEIDFIKGVAIISVILLHTLSQNFLSISRCQLHIGQAVPLFLFVTFYLSFWKISSKDDGKVFSRWFTKRRFFRVVVSIIIPFIIVSVLEAVIMLISGESLIVKDVIRAGGCYGPGSYYLIIYIQLWLLIPILYWLLSRFAYGGGLAVLLVCIVLNFLCVKFGVPSWMYRISCVRYIFLCVPVYFYLKRQNVYHFNWFCAVCVAISFVYLLFCRYLNLSPVILDYGWSYQQWPSYFWTLFVFIVLIRLGKRLKDNRVFRFLTWMGKNSWYIFLTEMFVLNYLSIDAFSYIHSVHLRRIVFIIVITGVSCIPSLLVSLVSRCKSYR